MNIALIHLGGEDTVQPMGLDNMALWCCDDPQFVKSVIWRYAEWCARTVAHLNHMDVGPILALNDVADNHGPWLSPDIFREIFMPPVREVAGRIKKPWMYHTEELIEPLLPGLVTLGMNDFQSVQPGPLDIGKVKGEWGDRSVLHGNIDMAYSLT